MVNAPDVVEPKQLSDLHIASTATKEEKVEA